MKEQWKDVKGFEEYYQISDQGNVYSKRSERLLHQSLTGSKYPKVSFSIKQGRTYHMVHRLVAEAFISNPENKRTVNHIDGNKSNNNLSNLEWNSYSENCLHAFRTGLHIPHDVTGIKNPRALVTEDEVRGIRKMLETKLYFDREIAKVYGVSRELINAIKLGKTWKELV